jgi:Protein of unknown function (DUF5818)
MNRAKLLCLMAGLLLAVGAAGCADPGRDDGAGQGGAAAAPTTAAPPTTLPTGPPTTRPARPAGPVTVAGTVSQGVEPGCLLLDAEGGTRYLLVGGERAELRPGRRVAVTGRVDRSLLSTCQQGEPLVVTSIEPAP